MEGRPKSSIRIRCSRPTYQLFQQWYKARNTNNTRKHPETANLQQAAILNVVEGLRFIPKLLLVAQCLSDCTFYDDIVNHSLLSLQLSWVGSLTKYRGSPVSRFLPFRISRSGASLLRCSITQRPASAQHLAASSSSNSEAVQSTTMHM